MRGHLALLALLAGCSRLVDLGGLTGEKPEADAGPMHDAGTLDAGPHDGGAHDAGHDPAVDAAVDAGVDAGPVCPVVAGMEMAFIEAAQGSYCIDRTEVTNEQYLDFYDNRPTDLDTLFVTQGCKGAGDVTPLVPWPPNAGRERFPVGGVSYCGAEAYCTFVGKTLCGDIATGGNLDATLINNPTHDAWMRACGGSERLRFPYGDTYDSTACNGVGSHGNTAIPAGDLPTCVSEDGVYDLSGNVWEWVAACESDVSTADVCNLRGGAGNAGEPELACDASPNKQQKAAEVENFGFRCCLHKP